MRFTVGITLFVALGVIEASWFVLSVAAMATLLMQLIVIPTEEHALTDKFGERYRTYSSRTGRWLPRAVRPDPGADAI